MSADPVRAPAAPRADSSRNVVRLLSAVVDLVERRRVELQRLSRLVSEIELTGLGAVSGDRTLLNGAMRQLAQLRRALTALADRPVTTLRPPLEALHEELAAPEPWSLVEESLHRLTRLRTSIRAAVVEYDSALSAWRLRIADMRKAVAQAE